MDFEKLTGITENVLFNEEMSRHTTFRIGGKCTVFVNPKTVEELKNVIALFKEENYPYMIAGNGSNMLISDEGLDGAVIHIGRNMSECVIDGCKVYAQSGILMARLASELAQAGLSGFERLSGIPGSLGGGIFMNAGAYGSELKDVIKSVDFLDSEGNVRTFDINELKMGYRTSVFQDKDYVILSCVMEFKKGNADEIKAEMSEYRRRRNEKQPVELPSAGSAFKRPEGYFAAKLIEDSGLKGYTVGGAAVSEKHAGFIVNKGGATAEDVLKLIEHIQKTVQEKFDVELTPEIRLISQENFAKRTAEKA